MPWVLAAEKAQDAVKRAIDRYGTSPELREAHDALTALLTARSDPARDSARFMEHETAGHVRRSVEHGEEWIAEGGEVP